MYIHGYLVLHFVHIILYAIPVCFLVNLFCHLILGLFLLILVLSFHILQSLSLQCLSSLFIFCMTYWSLWSVSQCSVIKPWVQGPLSSLWTATVDHVGISVDILRASVFLISFICLLPFYNDHHDHKINVMCWLLVEFLVLACSRTWKSSPYWNWSCLQDSYDLYLYWI